jgi:hypothetical protein
MQKDEVHAPAVAQDEEPGDILDLVRLPDTASRRIDGVSIGKLHGFDASGRPLVDFPESPTGGPLPVRTTIAPTSDDVGREVALLFEGGAADRPILMGFLQAPRALGGERSAAAAPREVQLDGERLVLSAQQEIVLRCGKASITLTRAGKVLIRGAYLLSRSSGVNRIKGGSVQIN